MTASTTWLHNRHKALYKLTALAFWLTIWQLISMAIGSSVLIPSPLETAASLFEIGRTADFWQSALYSLMRILFGYLLGVIFGILLAAATSFIQPLKALFSPLLGVIRATPVASFILLALVWLKKDYVPVLTVFLMVLPIVWANVTEGFASADKSLLEVSQIFRFGRIKTLRGIYLPAVYPYLSAGALTAMGLGWKAGIAAEVIAVPLKSIGAGLHESKIYIETPQLFAWTVVVILLSIILENTLKALSGRWKRA